jgi:hypothetical protein
MVIDTLRHIDLRRCVMRISLFKGKEQGVTFCDRCGSVCDDGCRRNAVREAALQRGLAGRFGI